MARINLEEDWKSNPRRELLGSLLGNILFVEGVCYRLWDTALLYWTKGLLVPGDVFLSLPYAKELIEAKFVKVYKTDYLWQYPINNPKYPHVPQIPRTELERESNERVRNPNEPGTNLEQMYFYANGSRDYFFWLINMRLQRVEAGKKSSESRKLKFGSAQPKRKTPNEARTKPNEAERSPNGAEPSYSSSSSNSYSINIKNKKGSETKKTKAQKIELPPDPIWEAYETSYLETYKTKPVRNAKVNGQFKSLKSRLPLEELPAIIRFYVSHPNPFYVKNMHQIGHLLSDAEKVYTEFKSGIKIIDIKTGLMANGKYLTPTQKRMENNEKNFAQAMKELEQEQRNSPFEIEEYQQEGINYDGSEGVSYESF